MSLELNGLDFHGRTGVWLESVGHLTTDKYGLSTGSCTYVCPTNYGIPNYPSINSFHEIWSFLACEKRTISVEYGFTRMTLDYAGFEGEIPPIIEYGSAISEEPIQTHPNFEGFAGTASSPLNDAVWVDVETNKLSTDNTRAIWSHFAGNNDFTGLTSYLSPHFTKKETTLTKNYLLITGVGKLDGNLLLMGASSVQRGAAWVNTREWRGPGVGRPFNAALY